MEVPGISRGSHSKVNSVSPKNNLLANYYTKQVKRCVYLLAVFIIMAAWRMLMILLVPRILDRDSDNGDDNRDGDHEENVGC